MVNAALSPDVKAWLRKNCNRSETEDVTQWVLDVRAGGFDHGDADIIKLAAKVPVGTAIPGLSVSCFVVPLRVSTRWRLGRTVWLGVIETSTGPSAFRGRVDLVVVFDTDPTLSLVQAEAQILAAAGQMYP